MTSVADTPRSLRLEALVTGWDVPAELDVAASDSDGTSSLRRFAMTAYTGGPMRLAGWTHPVVIDLAGLKVTEKSRPILKDHNRGLIVGHTNEIRVEADRLDVAGVISGAGAVAREVVESSRNGFPWQASVGATAERVDYVPKGRRAEANGREFEGPLHIARKATLGEISFVALGADDDTTAQITGSPATGSAIAADRPETDTMQFDQWLEAKGFAETDLSEAQATSLRAMFESEHDCDDESASPVTAADERLENDPVARMRTDTAAELERIASIRAICRGAHPKIEAEAVREGWDGTRAELEVLRAERPTVTATLPRSTGAARINQQTLEAACVLSGRLPNPERHCSEQDLEAASREFGESIGLQELLLHAAWANGHTGRTFRDFRGVMDAAFGRGMEASGPSTISIGGILSNVANKFLLDGFFSVERTWRNICSVRSVTDFKTVTSFRLTGSDTYQRVAPGGEIKHGTLGEETYSNKAETYGLMLSIDRSDIINDDLGAITSVPRKLGAGSGKTINEVFWAAFLDNASFFSTGNKNFLSGAASALTIDGLTDAEVKFMDQVDADGKPIGVLPQILLVPTALSAMGTQLFKSMELRDNSSSAKYPVTNPHQGKFRVEVSRYIGNAAFTGSSARAWYLLGDPDDLPVIEVAFLNGREAPTIETAEQSFNRLGIQMRGYHDFGVALQDPRGGVKSKGEA